MRPSKNDKHDRMVQGKNQTKTIRELKKKKRAKKIKYQAWLDLPYEEWTDDRKAHQDEEVKTMMEENKELMEDLAQ